jgi:hypothetical protein
LTLFNPLSETIVKQFNFENNDDAIRLAMNTTKDELYFINID